MILFGTGIEGEKFFCKYKDEVEIDFVIDNNRHGMKFHGIDCYALSEIGDKLRYNKIIVTTSRKVYSVIKLTLLEIGLEEYKDFIHCDYFGKKIALFYGNCHIGAIAEYLSKNHAFANKYAIIYYYVDESNPFGEVPNDCDIKFASLIIMHDIRDENKLKIPSYSSVLSKCSDKTKVIVVPNLWGINFLWPQVNENRNLFGEKILKRHFNNEGIIEELYDTDEVLKEKKGIAVELISHKDEFIENNIEKSTAELVWDIINKDIYTQEYIESMFSKAITKLKKRENKCTISISDYIIANISKIQLFYDEGHPHENIIFEKGRRILDILNLPIEGENDVSLKMDSMEIFIYGCVKKVFNISWNQKYIRCKDSKYTMDGHGISLSEYVDAYRMWR